MSDDARTNTRLLLAWDAKQKLNDYAENVGKLKDFRAAEKALRDFDAQNGTSND